MDQATDPDPHPFVRPPRVLSGLLLRYVLTLILLHRGRVMSVSELCTELERCGVATRGRTSKDVSDALRWEIRRGRVRRVGRGTYVTANVVRQTAWRMRRRLAELSIVVDR